MRPLVEVDHEPVGTTAPRAPAGPPASCTHGRAVVAVAASLVGRPLAAAPVGAAPSGVV